MLDLLAYLVEHRDRVVTKDDLIASIWGGRAVSDTALTSRIYAARKAIGDTGRDQKLIRTIARKGLRFIGTLDASVGGTSLARGGAAAGRSTGGAAPRRAGSGPPGDRRAALQQHERRSRAGVFLGRDQRGSDHRAVQAALVLRDRAQLLLHLQEQGRACAAGRRRTRRRLCGRGQRSQERRSRAHHRAAQRRLERQPPLGRALRPRRRRRVRGAGRDHGGHRRGDRAAALCRREFPRALQASEQPRRVGAGDARAVALGAGVAAGPCDRAGAAAEGDRDRPRLLSGARRAERDLHLRCAYGVGRCGCRGAARRARGAGRGADRRRGSLGALCTRRRPPDHAAISTTRWLRSSWRSISIPAFRMPRTIMPPHSHFPGAGRKPPRPPSARCG